MSSPRPVLSRVIARFLRDLEAGHITSDEAGAGSLRTLAGALSNIARGVDPDTALEITRAPAGRPADFWSWIIGNYVEELRAVDVNWDAIEAEVNEWLQACGRKRLSLRRLKQLHKQHRGTEGLPDPLVKAWEKAEARKKKPLTEKEIYTSHAGGKPAKKRR
jgi:hypothetical protein